MNKYLYERIVLNRKHISLKIKYVFHQMHKVAKTSTNMKYYQQNLHAPYSKYLIFVIYLTHSL